MSSTNERAVDSNLLTVEYWREQLLAYLPKNNSLRELHELLARRDDYYQRITGYARLQNITNRRGGVQPTARTVKLLQQMKEEADQAP